ncbi:MAG: molybdopterin-binding protein [Bacteroidales bacterium]|nr:molybdopterin-binding protein [Bacteroidales bacterium]MDT8430744.1 molybdopterin-binding protein [Bacteroidales bacterium]
MGEPLKTLEVVSVNISEEKGTVKVPVSEIELYDQGVKGDAHAGSWHRQVSLLARESIAQAEAAAGEKFPDGTFAENITTAGIEIHKTNILDRFENDTVALEVTQIGKKCHAKCAIGRKVGNCIMPLEGIFARVTGAGVLKPGDRLEYHPKIFRSKIITLSDRASAGTYEDQSGPEIEKECTAWAEKNRLNVRFDSAIIPDDREVFENELKASLSGQYDMLFTTGSTGIGARDIAPETIAGFLEKEIPGIMEMIRSKYGAEKPNAFLSRSICGTTGKTLVFALPGSPKAVREYLEEIRKVLFHMILMVHGINAH